MASKKNTAENKMGLVPDEQTFQLMFETYPAVMLLIEPVAGRILDANQSAINFYGYPREKLCSMLIHEINTLSAEQMAGESQKALNEERNYFIFPQRLASGAERIVEVHSSMIVLQEKQLLFSIVHDITDRRQAEETLRESEEKYRRLFDNAILGIFQSTPQGEPISVNYAFARMFGYDSPADAIRSIRNIATDIFSDSNRQAEIARLMADNPDLKLFENVYRRKDGSTFVGNLYTMPMRDSDGRLLRVEGIIEDITERKQAEEALRESEERHRALIEWSPEPLAVHRGGEVVYVNPAAVKMWGAHSAQDLVGKPILDLVHPDYHQNVLEWARHAAEHGGGMPLHEERYIKQDGTEIDVEVQATSIVYNGEAAFQIVAHDITERKQAEDQLLQLLRDVEQSPVAIMITDRNGIIEYVNLKFTAVSGYTLDEMLGKIPHVLKSDKMPPEIYTELWQTILSGKEWRGEFLNRKKDGKLYWEYASISAITDPLGNITHLVAVNEDITDRKAAEEKIRLLNAELEQLALTDYLTNLFNRRYFMQRGAEELKRANRNTQPLALLMLDIDEFKKVNDTYGHEAGDLALKQVALALKSSLREIDILGRMGGEEFAVLLPNTLLDNATLLAERIRQSIANIPFQMSVEALIIPITISIGVAAYTEDMSGIDDLLRNADKALYYAKNNGRNCVMKYKEISDGSSALGDDKSDSAHR